MQWVIRPGQKRDGEQIVELLCRQMREHELPAEPERIRAAMERVWTSPAAGAFLVAAIGEELAGVAYVAFLHSMEHGGTISLLEELYVRAEFRGKGLGSALLGGAIEEFSTKRGTPMELEVDATHAGVEALYVRHGFTRRERTRWIYRPGGG